MTEHGESLITSIAILGGTGKEGSALALRWAMSGYKVIIGSRTAERAQQTAQELNERIGGEVVEGYDNIIAAQKGNMVVLSVPYSAHRDTLESVREYLEGKILIDLTVPLAPPNVTHVNVPAGLSAGQEAQVMLGDGVRVVSAFQNVSYSKLRNPDTVVDCDVLVCGDDEAAKEEVIRLAEAADLRGLDAGPLANAVAVEALTSVLLYISKKYKSPGSGIRITGLA